MPDRRADRPGLCPGFRCPSPFWNADALRAHGFAGIWCIVTSDPYTVAAWAREIDPDRKIRFLSDGNLEFARALGLVSNERKLMLGERSARYAITIQNGLVKCIRAEVSVLEFSCTRAEAMMAA